MICPECGKNNSDEQTTCECRLTPGCVDQIEKTVVLSEDVVADKIKGQIGGARDKAVHDTIVNDILSMTGSVIGKCRLEEMLGKGGMGVVYKAHHTALDIPVAVKIMLPNFSDATAFDQRFHREAQVAARINHQNVVRVYDCGSEDGKLYIVMEYVDGGDLSNILEEGSHLSVKQGLDIALSICSALVEAEKFDIIHRDIKPENIMVTCDGVYKLADLGLAKQINTVSETDLSLTVDNICMGSPLYMSPEQAVDAKHCDVRADIYSLGCTLYALLTGYAPYTGDNWQEVVCKHATSSVPHVKALCDTVPAELDRIIARCMEKKADDRYGSAHELFNALNTVADSTSSDAGTFTRVGTADSNESRLSSETAYRTETTIQSAIYEKSDSRTDLRCSSCGTECVTRSSLKYICSHDGCEKRICMDCWMRNGIRTCSDHTF